MAAAYAFRCSNCKARHFFGHRNLTKDERTCPTCHAGVLVFDKAR